MATLLAEAGRPYELKTELASTAAPSGSGFSTPHNEEETRRLRGEVERLTLRVG